MSLRETNRRIIFGLKIKQKRLQLKLSPTALASSANMSVSYLNEIEKGKKFPKATKMSNLANALGCTVNNLVSPELDKSMAPLARLLRSNFLNELPLDFFGIELSKVVEIIAESPARVGAFISTMVDLAQSYAIQEPNFYEAALRSYQELHNNHFPEIENHIARFSEEFGIRNHHDIEYSFLKNILEEKYAIQVREMPSEEMPALRFMRAVYVADKKCLYINANLSDELKTSQLAREIGFHYMELSERVNTTPVIKIDSFEQILNQFKSTYFSAGILVQKDIVLKDLKKLFKSKTWNVSFFIGLINSYKVTPETLFLRFSQLLSPHFGFEDVFFFRLLYNSKTDKYELDRELQLGNQKQPQYRNGLNLHYCKRWLGIRLLEDERLNNDADDASAANVAIQKSKFYETGTEYLTISLVQNKHNKDRLNSSLSVHLQINEKLKETINFLNDPEIKTRVVNSVCETCPIQDCKERAAPATLYHQRKQRRETERAVRKLMD